MTEADWLKCTDPTPMLEFLRRKASERKLRLFAVACCRTIWDLLIDERSQQAIDAAEQYADGFISDENLGIFRTAARSARRSVKQTTRLAGSSPYSLAAHAADTVVDGSVESAVAAVGLVASAIGAQAIPDPANGDFDDAYEAIWHFGMFHACPLLRDIFGNPFHPITVDPTWQLPTVVHLAQSIYDDRAFDRMPELADALCEAGCDNDEIVSHCRGPGPHVRGCWALDLVLGKE